MSAGEQQAICQGTTNAGTARRIIVATEVAETGVIVRGVRNVIDTGFVQRPVFNAITGEASLQEVLVSQSSASQKAGRAAREGLGTTWRLYTESEYSEMEPHSRSGICADDLFAVQWRSLPAPRPPRVRKLGINISEATKHLLTSPT